MTDSLLNLADILTEEFKKNRCKDCLNKCLDCLEENCKIKYKDCKCDFE